MPNFLAPMSAAIANKTSNFVNKSMGSFRGSLLFFMFGSIQNIGVQYTDCWCYYADYCWLKSNRNVEPNVGGVKLTRCVPSILRGDYTVPSILSMDDFIIPIIAMII